MSVAVELIQPAQEPLTEVPGPIATPTLGEIPYGYRPSKSLSVSVVAHLLVFWAIVFVGRHSFLQPIVVKPQLETAHSSGILVLPTLGGGHEGTGKAGGGAGKSPTHSSSGLRAQSRRGFAYPGTQPIVSNPPHAKLGIQTILQPSLKNLPLLRHYVPLPNIVQPPPEVASKAPDIVVRASNLSFRHPRHHSVAAPRIKLPVSEHQAAALLVTTKPVLPQKAVPVPEKAVEQTSVQHDQKGLLVLNALPDVGGRLPQAEARSLFAVSPGDATIIADPAAGTKSGEQAAMAAGNGNRVDIVRGDALAEIPSGGEGADNLSNSSGTGAGGHYGNAEGKGLNSEAGSGVGHGVASGSGLGTESAKGAGTGSGAGSAPGRGGFPGITIQGGRYGNTNVANVGPKLPTKPKSYNMTIVSTANSGGGLPDVGVFQNEKVYTVYLDMRSSEEDTAQSWTLQYALLQPDDPPGVPVARIEGTPTPPYASLKEVPKITRDQAHKYGHRLIIASAIMNTEGKLEQLKVKQSPEASLVPLIIEALTNWSFEPAKIDGQPVALKVLLGIRLSLSH